MIIPSRKIPAYFHGMIFPVEILAEKDDRVMYVMTQEQLSRLIAKEGVIGIGSWKRIKRLRLVEPIMKTARRLREKTYNTADQKLHYRETVSAARPVTLKRWDSERKVFVYWGDRDGFDPRRFNPDAIPEPLRRF